MQVDLEFSISFVDMFLALDKDCSGSLSKQELKEYADGTLTEIFIERGEIQLLFDHCVLFMVLIVTNSDLRQAEL